MTAESPATAIAGEPERIFLGSEQPLIESAARWILARARGPRADDRLELVDLRDTLVVVPGRRGGRRLLTRLAVDPRGRSTPLVPPTVTTLSGLPELLLPRDHPVASEVMTLIARVEALRAAAPSDLLSLLPEPPSDDDLASWLQVAHELERLESELGAGGLRIADARRLASTGVGGRVPFGPREEERWESLAKLERDALRRLADCGLRSRHDDRLRRLAEYRREGRSRSGGGFRRVWLVGVADLPFLFRQVLEAQARDVEIAALVGCDERDAELVDSWGCPRPAAWRDRHLDYSGTPALCANRPADQAAVAAARARSMIEENGGRGVVTVAVGEPMLVPLVADALSREGLSHHLATGRSVSASPPARVLEALARYLGSRRVEDLAMLAREPAVERYLNGRFDDEGSWLARFDRELEQCLAQIVEDPVARGSEGGGRGDGEHDAVLPGASAGDLLRAVEGELRALAPSSGQRLPLPAWASEISALLVSIFGGRPLDPALPAESDLLEALGVLGGRLREVAEVDLRVSRTWSFSDAVTLLLAALRSDEVHSEPAGPAQVEVVGWLELPLDDAQRVVVVGMTEGSLPSSVTHDVFLPDRVRSSLGLVDDAHRLARDLHLTEQLLTSRRALALVTGRRGLQGEPLHPSRLLLASEPEELASSLRRLLTGDRLRSRWESSDHSTIQVPRPEPLPEPIEKLPVTAFRDYLSCPYRFYLRRVLDLRPSRGIPAELDGATFGSLAHEVLRRFALGPMADSADRRAIAVVLDALIDDVAGARFGARPRPTVRVQIAQLRRRLEVFARWQADQVAVGWRMDPAWCERSLTATLDVDGAPFEIHGRLDRVDVHPQRGVRIVDYKTGDSPITPVQAHAGPRQSDGRPAERSWVDLQLPLYAYLARSHGLHPPPAADQEVPELGFYCLSKKLGSEPYSTAPWNREDLESAVSTARTVVRALREERFWPPGPPPRWDDGLGGICGDLWAPRYRAGETGG